MPREINTRADPRSGFYVRRAGCAIQTSALTASATQPREPAPDRGWAHVCPLRKGPSEMSIQSKFPADAGRTPLSPNTIRRSNARVGLSVSVRPTIPANKALGPGLSARRLAMSNSAADLSGAEHLSTPTGVHRRQGRLCGRRTLLCSVRPALCQCFGVSRLGTLGPGAVCPSVSVPVRGAVLGSALTPTPIPTPGATQQGSSARLSARSGVPRQTPVWGSPGGGGDAYGCR